MFFWGLFACIAACRAAPQSGAGTGPAAGTDLKSLPGRRLHGRFLHITDIHPDPFFKTYSSTEADAACHRKRGPAGIYGAETSGCDSPVSLVNETFKWINENLKDSIDFIIWTGDSARHDNDEKIPRSQKQVIAQNELIVSKFVEVFGTGDGEKNPMQQFSIPIVPTFGNNDILPHNIFLSGPNKWTLKYLDIWRSFIPEAQRHQFQQGGWFYVEVIPRKLAAISLNTLYFFDSNSGVDGCANKHEPGYEHMEWLRVQLQILRERGMKAILTGHVPPARTDSKQSWDETCWQKYTLWERQYRDIIVGSLFGHMNIDHFMLQDFKELKKGTKKGRMATLETDSMELRDSMLEDGEVTVESASDYLIDLRDAWARLPTPPKSKKKSLSIAEYADTDQEDVLSIWQWIMSKLYKSRARGKGGKGGKSKKKFLDKIGGRYGERFSVAHVSPSVVPNYFPTLRIFSYNISGLEDTVIPVQKNGPTFLDSPSTQTPIAAEGSFSDDAAWERQVHQIVKMKKRKKGRDLRKKQKKYKFKVPAPPSKSAPPGPAYSPQPLTLLGYVQYYANLTHINNDFVSQSETSVLDEYEADETISTSESDEVGGERWKEGKHHKHQGKRPRPKPHPKKFKYEVEYNTMDDKLFRLKDLTVRSYVDLARRIGHEKSQKSQNLPVEDEEEDEDESPDDDINEEESEDDDEPGDEELKANKKKGKKRKGKHGKKPRKDGAWYTFVKRAFVNTLDPRDIEENFGVGGAEVEPDADEMMEL